MVEGLNARALVIGERMNGLVGPGTALFVVGISMPILVSAVNSITGRLSHHSIDVFDALLSAVMLTGMAMVAFSITYRRRGDIFMPLLSTLLLLFSFDLFSWFYFTRIHYLPDPSGTFILPYTVPGELPFALTLIFMFAVITARYTYTRDPRKSGRPKYFR